MDRKSSYFPGVFHLIRHSTEKNNSILTTIVKSLEKKGIRIAMRKELHLNGNSFVTR